MRTAFWLGFALLLVVTFLSASTASADEALPCALTPAVATPAPFDGPAAVEPPAMTPVPEQKVCFWAWYEEYFDAGWNYCGFYNSCTGERQWCQYAHRTQEIFPCCT